MSSNLESNDIPNLGRKIQNAQLKCEFQTNNKSFLVKVYLKYCMGYTYAKKVL